MSRRELHGIIENLKKLVNEYKGYERYSGGSVGVVIMNVRGYRGNRYSETRYERIIKLANFFCHPNNALIVDLGAGSNPISQYIPKKESITLDFNHVSNPDIVCDLNSGIPLKNNVCDIVIATEVIEHIYYSKNLFCEILRVLKPSGCIILSTPNACSLLYRIFWFLGRVPPFAAKADYTYSPSGFAGGHVRDYNFSELERILTDSGFDIIKSTTNGVVYNWFSIPYYLLPKTFGQKIIIVAQKVGKIRE
jgi:SAM-dependent methyltransferase